MVEYKFLKELSSLSSFNVIMPRYIHFLIVVFINCLKYRVDKNSSAGMKDIVFNKK